MKKSVSGTAKKLARMLRSKRYNANQMSSSFSSEGFSFDEQVAALKKTSVATFILNVVNNKHFRTTFEITKDVASSIVEFHEKGSPWSLITGLGSVVLKLAEAHEVSVWDFFDGWSELLTKDFVMLTMNIIKDYPYTDIDVEDHSIIRIHDVDGRRVGYTLSKKFDVAKKIYVQPEDQEYVEEIIRKALWTKFDGKSVVIKKNRKLMIFNDEDTILFEVDDNFNPLSSEKAEELARYYKKFLDKDISRSLLLYGPPGTGKSTMARSIISNLKLKSFRIKLNDLSHMDGSTLNEAIKIFKPDALILDDLDRSNNQEDLLETLEVLHSTLKLIIATANNTSRFDRALLRPERFDDIELIEQLDDNVIIKLLGEHQDVFEEVKHWPIVFIEDLVKRFEVMSEEDAKKSIRVLSERVTQVCSYETSDTWDRFSSPQSKRSVDKTLANISPDELVEVYNRIKEEEDDSEGYV